MANTIRHQTSFVSIAGVSECDWLDRTQKVPLPRRPSQGTSCPHDRSIRSPGFWIGREEREKPCSDDLAEFLRNSGPTFCENVIEPVDVPKQSAGRSLVTKLKSFKLSPKANKSGDNRENASSCPSAIRPKTTERSRRMTLLTRDQPSTERKMDFARLRGRSSEPNLKYQKTSARYAKDTPPLPAFPTAQMTALLAVTTAKVHQDSKKEGSSSSSVSADVIQPISTQALTPIPAVPAASNSPYPMDPISGSVLSPRDFAKDLSHINDLLPTRDGFPAHPLVAKGEDDDDDIATVTSTQKSEVIHSTPRIATSFIRPGPRAHKVEESITPNAMTYELESIEKNDEIFGTWEAALANLDAVTTPDPIDIPVMRPTRAPIVEHKIESSSSNFQSNSSRSSSSGGGGGHGGGGDICRDSDQDKLWNAFCDVQSQLWFAESKARAVRMRGRQLAERCLTLLQDQQRKTAEVEKRKYMVITYPSLTSDQQTSLLLDDLQRFIGDEKRSLDIKRTASSQQPERNRKRNNESTSASSLYSVSASSYATSERADHLE